MGGFFVVACFGGGLHLHLQVGEPFAGLAIEKGAGGIHAFEVVGLVELVGVLVDFGAGVVVEPPSLVVELERFGIAEEDAEFAAQFVEGLAQVRGVSEGTVVARFTVGAVTGESEARQWFAQVDTHEEEALVVGKIGVVARLVFFDELPFEQQRFGLGFDDDQVEVVDQVDHGAHFRLRDHGLARGLKVGRDTLLQILGFADIDGLPEAIFHQINAWLVWQASDFFFDVNFV